MSFLWNLTNFTYKFAFFRKTPESPYPALKLDYAEEFKTILEAFPNNVTIHVPNVVKVTEINYIIKFV